MIGEYCRTEVFSESSLMGRDCNLRCRRFMLEIPELLNVSSNKRASPTVTRAKTHSPVMTSWSAARESLERAQNDLLHIPFACDQEKIIDDLLSMQRLFQDNSTGNRESLLIMVSGKQIRAHQDCCASVTNLRLFQV